MRLNRHAAVAVLAVLGVAAAIIVPAQAGAQKVFNPGSFRLDASGGYIRVGTSGLIPLFARSVMYSEAN